MARPMWKGTISFGLVMIPVVMFSGEAHEAGIDLDMLDSRDHARIRFKRVNEKTGQEVPWKNIVRGFQRDGHYVVLTPDDLKAAASEAVKGGIEILEFVDAADISPRHFEKPYVVEPGKGGEKGYKILRDVLERTGKAGIARVVIATRERLAALMVEDDTLVLITMRHGEELRDPDEVGAEAAARISKTRTAAKEIEMAEQLVEGMTSDWDPERHHDTYKDTLRKIIARKSKLKEGEEISRPEAPEPTESTDIMALLRQSLEEHKGAGRRTSTASKRRTAGRTASASRRRKAG